MVGSPVPGSSRGAGGSTSRLGATLPSSPFPVNVPVTKPGSLGALPSGAPGRSSADASGPASWRLASAYSAESSALTGTSVKSGSPYQASRSANASLPHSVTVCR